MNSPKHLNSLGNNHDAIALVGIQWIDVAIHNLVRGLVVFVSLVSKLPGVVFILPAIFSAQFPKIQWVSYNDYNDNYYYYSSKLFCFYLLTVALFLILCLSLYFVSENFAARRRLCRYLDAPEVVYPDNFDEEKGRELAEQGFTYKYLGNKRDHTVRVIVVPIALVCLSTTALRSICASLLGIM